MNDETKKLLAAIRSLAAQPAITPISATHKERLVFLLTLLDQAQRDTERVEKVMTLKQLADLKEILVIGQQSHRRELKAFGTLDQIIENITPYDAAIYTVDQALDQAALARGEETKP